MWTYDPLCAVVENEWSLVCIPVMNSWEMLCWDYCLMKQTPLPMLLSLTVHTNPQTLFPLHDWCRLEQGYCLFWASHEHLSFDKLLQMISEQKGLPLALKCLCGEKPPLESSCHELCVCCMMPPPPHPPFSAVSVVMIKDEEGKWTGRPFHWPTLAIHHRISDLASDDKSVFCWNCWFCLLLGGCLPGLPCKRSGQEELHRDKNLSFLEDLLETLLSEMSLLKLLGMIRSGIKPLVLGETLSSGSSQELGQEIVSVECALTLISLYLLWNATLVTVSLLSLPFERQSVLVLPKIRRSSEYITQQITRFCRKWTRIGFVISINNPGAGPGSKGRTQ